MPPLAGIFQIGPRTRAKTISSLDNQSAPQAGSSGSGRLQTSVTCPPASSTTFRIPPAQNPTFLQFGTNLQGDVETVAVALEEAASPIVFRRRASPVMSDPAYLARFVGTYAGGGTTVRVAQRGKGLLVETSDGRSLELGPYRGTEYRAVDGSAARAVFSPDHGQAMELLLITTHGAVRAERSARGVGRP